MDDSMGNLENDIENIIEQNTLEKVNDKVYLTKYQIQVLEENNIPYKSCNTMSELIFLLSDIAEEEEFDELESVARQIEEFHYYNEVRK